MKIVYISSTFEGRTGHFTVTMQIVKSNVIKGDGGKRT